MSPAESGVKIRSLSHGLGILVNDGENEAGTHKILSRSRPARLHIGRCDSKDSPTEWTRLFLVNAAKGRLIATDLASFITLWLWHFHDEDIAG